ncbi:MAG: phospho-sugar mutase [Bulleidia sp.]
MSYQEEYQKWLHSPALSEAEKEELRAIANDPKEIKERFYGPLEFGTAGLRGTMHVGLHNMNVHVIKWATQAFAEVILAEGEEAAKKGVAIDFDCRNHSEEFARTAASVLAANGISVRIFDGLRPTPEVSFAVREYGCIAGINVTASHNPAAYNGYKVYWSDGAQLPPQHAAMVAKKMSEIDIFADVKEISFETAVKEGRIQIMNYETDEAFLRNVLSTSNDSQLVHAVRDSFKVVYTPFHGCGYKMIPEVLRRIGMKNVYCEPQQMIIDGNFPTVESPNPENPEGFYLAVELADKVGADFILGSDPDADRVGIMVKNEKGEFIPLSGNQTGALFLEYYIDALKRNHRMPEHPVALKSIVSTDLVRKIAEANGVALYDTFTGFKFMAEKKNQLEAAGEGHVIWAFEESYGYMVGDYVRDKDAVTACMLLTEMAAYYASRHMTIYQALGALYEKYGNYAEKTLNLIMPGLDGVEKMQNLMKNLREHPLTEIVGEKVVIRKDYADGTLEHVETGEKEKLELCNSNVLEYGLADGSKILIRPSGTEPKVKVYLLIQGETAASCRERCEKFATWADSLKN